MRFRKIIRYSLYVIGSLLVLAFLLVAVSIKPLDTTHYHTQKFYKRYKSSLKDVNWNYVLADSSSFKSGWAKANITPDYQTPMAGYSPRGLYETVHDSLFVRTILFKNKGLCVAYITLDLLIVPYPIVEKVQAQYPEVDHFYFSATHTHSGIGSWLDGVGGRYIAGDFQQETVDYIAKQIGTSINEAQKNIITTQILYGKADAQEMVRNRLVGEKGITDPFIRTLILNRSDSSSACIVSFSAHATCTNKKAKDISRDFPGVVVDSLEKGQFDFAMYSAGAVGSHGPLDVKPYTYENMNVVARGVLAEVKNSIKNAKTTESGIGYMEIDVPLGDARVRLHPNWQLRNWVFDYAMPDWPTKVKVLQLGKVVFVGMPCDFSGELNVKLEQKFKNKSLILNTTSFNGGYVGYIIPDKYYTLDKYEPRDMNWFGPNTGEYFSEVLMDILDFL